MIWLYAGTERTPKMNRLELALLDASGIQLDLYLEDSKTKDIMADIEAIKRKAASTTDAGKLKLAITELLDSI